MKTKTLTKAVNGERPQAVATIDAAVAADVHVQPADHLNLQSPQAELVSRRRAGNALVLQFDDGQSVVLEDFYAPQAADAVPSLVVSTGTATELFVGSGDGVSEVPQGLVAGTSIDTDTRIAATDAAAFTDTQAPKSDSDSDSSGFFPLLFAGGALGAFAYTAGKSAPIVPPIVQPGIKIDAIAPDTGVSDHDYITRATTLTVRGSTERLTHDQRVQVSSDGGSNWYDATMHPDGTWSYDDPLTHNGPFTYEARIVNAGDLQLSIVSQDVTVDTHASTAAFDGVSLSITEIIDDVAPVTGPVTNATNDTSPTLNGQLTGKLAADEFIAVDRDGVTVGTATLTANGWTFTDQNVPDGVHNYQAHVEDLAGNHGAASNVRTITVDTLPPDSVTGVSALAISTVQDNVGPVQGNVASGGTTDDTSPTLVLSVTGTLPADESIVIYRDNLRVGTANLSDGVWRFTDRGVANGAHDYFARVEDSAGNQGLASADYLITVDNQDANNGVVTVSITEVDDNVAPVTGVVPDHKSTNDTSPTLLGDYTGTLAAGDTVAIYRDGVRVGTATIADHTWSFTDSGLIDATYVYEARIENAGGTQRAASGDYTITVDTVPPDMVHGVSSLSITGIEDNVGAVQGNVANGGTTDDTSPTVVVSVAGTLLVGESIVIYRDNVRVGTASFINGEWSFTDRGLVNGAHSYMARVEDDAGNQGAVSANYLITVGNDDANNGVVTVAITEVNDNVAPVTGAVADHGATNDTSPTLLGDFTGTLAAGEVIAIYRDGVRVGTATLNGHTWSFTDSGLADATYVYAAHIENGAGVQRAVSGNFTITVDTVPPDMVNGVSALSISTIEDNVGAVQGNVANGGTTDDTSPTLVVAVSGTLLAGESIVIYRDDVRVGTASFANGEWSFTDRAVTNGAHTYVARVEDDAGNRGATSANYAITVANDDANNGLLSIAITGVDDNVAPVTGAVADHGSTNDTSPTLQGDFTGTMAAGDVIGIYRDGVRVGTATMLGHAWSFTDSGLADATYAYQARIESGAGVQRVASGNYTITVDTVPPDQVHGVSALAITGVEDNVGAVQGNVANGGTTDDTSPTIVVGITGTLLAGESIVIYRDSVRVGTASFANGEWSFTDRAVVNGAHAYMARVEDDAGNQGASSAAYLINVANDDANNGVVTVTITEVDDNVTPVTGVVSDHGATNDTSPTLLGDFTGTLAAGEVIGIYRGGVRVGTATLAGHAWSFTDSGLADATYVYEARIENGAGAQRAASGDYTITVDTVPPDMVHGVSALAISTIEDNVGVVQGSVTNGGTTDDTSPTLVVAVSGTLLAGESIVIYRDNARVGTASFINGEWSFTDRGLANGAHGYRAQVEDAAGNLGAISANYLINVDNQDANNGVVTVAITEVNDNVAPVTGAVADHGATNDTSPTLLGDFTGTLLAGEVIGIYRDGVRVGTATLNAHTWSFTDSGLADATYAYEARIENGAGVQRAASGDFTITVDTVPPDQVHGVSALFITAVEDNVGAVQGNVANGGTTDDTSPTLVVAVAGTLLAGETIVIYRDDARVGTASFANGEWSFTDRAVTNGAHTYVARVEDDAGNRGAASANYVITVANDDANNGLVTVSITGVDDNVAPLTGTVADHGATNDTSPTLQGDYTGTLAVGEVIGIYRGVLRVGTADLLGHAWSFTDRGLADGTYVYEARIETGGGASRAISSDYTITVDTVPPDMVNGVSALAITTVEDNVGAVQGNVASGGTTDDTSPTIVVGITGTLLAGESIVIYRDSVRVGTASFLNGEWSFTDRAVVNGAHAYMARVEDDAGNQGAASAAYLINVDNQDANNGVVTVTITEVDDNVAPVTGPVANHGATNDTSPTLLGDFTGTLAAGEVIGIYRDNVRVGTANLLGHAWSFTDSGLADASYVYEARIENGAGVQHAASNTFSITVDTVPPDQVNGVSALAITTIEDNVGAVQGNVANGGTTDDTSPTVVLGITGTLLLGESIVIYRDNVRVGTASFINGEWSFTDRAVVNGAHSYMARVEDDAGNQGAASGNYLITVANDDANHGVVTVSITEVNDNVAPVTGAVADHGATNDTSPTLLGDFTGTLLAGEVIGIYRGGARVGTATLNGHAWSFTDSGLADATYVYEARIENAGGAQRAISSDYTVTVDTVPPDQVNGVSAVAITAVIDNVVPVTGNVADHGATNDTSPTLNGTFTGPLPVGEHIAIYRDGVNVGTATVTGNTWTFTDSGLTDLTHTYLARVEDAAGNQGAASALYTITVDTVPPDMVNGVTGVAITAVTDDVAPVTGTVPDHGTTNDAAPALSGTFTGTLGAGEAIAIYRDGVHIGSATLNGNTWSYNDSGLTDATHSYVARVEDAAGNQGAASTSYTITVDTVPPDQVNGVSAVAITTVTDDVGPVTGPVANGGTTDDTSPTLSGSFTGTLPAGEHIAIARDGVDVGTATVTGNTWTFTDSGLADGAHNYVARVEDGAGNQGAASALYNITVSSAPPSNAVSITQVVDDVAPVTGVVTNGFTNDNSPTFNGSFSTLPGVSGAVVAIFRDGTRIGTATITGSGWSFTDSNLADAAYSYQAHLEDGTGNQLATSQTVPLTVDTVPPDMVNGVSAVAITAVTDDVAPVLGTVADNGATNDKAPTVSGTFTGPLPVGEQIVIYRDDVRVGTATITGNTWSFNDSGLTDATHTYLARVEDFAGNQGATSDVYTITVDTIPPDMVNGVSAVAITTVTDDVAPVTGAVADHGITNDNSPTLSGTFTGTLPAGEQIEIYRDGTLVGAATVTGNTWSFNDSGLTDATHTYLARVEDAAGNQGAASAVYTITVDTVPPDMVNGVSAVTITAVTDDVAPVLGAVPDHGATNDTSPALGGTFTGPLPTGEHIAIYRDGVNVGTATVTGNTWSFNDSGLTDATHTYLARVEDAAGNQGAASAVYTITVDTVPPDQVNGVSAVAITTVTDDVGPVTGAVANGGTTDDTSPSLSGTFTGPLPTGEHIAIYRDGANMGAATITGNTWSFNDSGLANGAHSYLARVEDAAGNQGATSNTQTLTVDTGPASNGVAISQILDDVAPVVGVVTNGFTNDTSPTFSGTFSTAPGVTGAQVGIFRDSFRIGTATLTGNTWTFTDSNLADAAYSYQVLLQDGLGNTLASSDIVPLTVDTVPPNTVTGVSAVAITAVTDDVAPVLGNVADHGATNDTSPTLSGSFTGPLPAGEHIAIYRDGVNVGTATITGNTWSFSDSGLTDATHTYLARVEDMAGNQGATSAVYTIAVDTVPPDTVNGVSAVTITTVTDDVAPVLGAVADHGATNDNAPTLSGSFTGPLPTGEHIAIYRDGVNVGTATVTGNTWSFSDSGLSDATHIYHAQVEDAAGNQGAVSADYTITVDTVPPDTVNGVSAVVITTVTDDVGPVTGPVANGGTTDDTSPTLSGSFTGPLPAGEHIAISRDGVDVGTATVTGNTWSFTDSGVADGGHQYVAHVEDAAGNLGAASAQYNIIVNTTGASNAVSIIQVFDDVAPVVGVVTNGFTNDNSPTLSGDFSTLPSVTGAQVAILRDGIRIGTATLSANSWSFTDSGLADATYTYQARLEDGSGNPLASSTAYPLTVDTVPPDVVNGVSAVAITAITDDVAPVTGPVADNGTTDDTSPSLSGTFTGTLPAGEAIVIYRNDVRIGTATVSGNTWSFNDSGLANASYTYLARVEDNAGNQGATSATHTIIVDAPLHVAIVAIQEDRGISATDFITADNELTVTGTADQGGTLTLTGAVQYQTDTGVATYNINQAVTINPDGTWQAQLVFGPEMGELAGQPITLLDNGANPPYTLTATWTNTGGDTFTDAKPIVIDSVAPDMLTQAVGPTAERQVNTFAKNNQLASRVVGLSDGGYVIVWASNGEETTDATKVGLYGQRYDASGNPVNGEFRVNTTIAGNQGLTASGDFAEMFDLVADPNGGFIVVWSSQQKGGSFDVSTPGVAGIGGAFNVFGQRYDANGQPVTTDIDGAGATLPTNEFTVNSGWHGTGSHAYVPRITALANGNFVVVWASDANATTGQGYDVRAQLFNASWQRIGGEFSVATGAGDQGYRVDAATDLTNLSVAATAGGGFKVVWSGGTSLAADNVSSVLYNAAGQVVAGSPGQVNTGTTGNQFGPVTATLADGSNVVVWVSNQGGTATGYDVYSQRYTAAGARIGVETRVNNTVTGNQGSIADLSDQVAVTALSNGGYVVVWAGRGPASATDDNIYMRVYSALGVPLTGQDVLVNQSIKGIQQLPHVAALDAGGFIVTWSSQYAGTDQGTDYAVMQRAYNDDGTPRPQALVSPEVLLDAGVTTNSQYGSTVSASSANHNVAVTWIQRSSTAAFGGNTTDSTKAALFDLAGHKIRDLDITPVAGQTEDGNVRGVYGKGSQVLALSNGSYVLLRDVQVTGQGANVYATVYGPDGTRITPSGSDIVATSATAGDQIPAGLVELRDANGLGTGNWVNLYIGKMASSNALQPQFGIFSAVGQHVGSDVVVSSHAPTANEGILTSLSGQETAADIAASSGHFAVVWSDNAVPRDAGTSDAVYLQMFTNTGVRQGNELRVNVSTLSNQSAPKIAALADGSFLVTWVSNHAGATYDVYQQRFAADGTRFSPEDELVSGGITGGNQGVWNTVNANERAQQQDVVALAGGGWVVTFVDNSTGTHDVLANVYDAAGNLMVGKIQLASVYSGTEEFYPSLSATDNGGFVATWTSNNTVLGDISGTGTYMRFFDANGHVRSFGEFQPAGGSVAIEPGLLIGGSANADAYNAAHAAIDPTFDVANDGLNANGDTASNLWKANVDILNFQPGDVLGVDSALATSLGVTVTYNAGHLELVFGPATTINNIETLLRSVTYNGGATPAPGDRDIEFSLVDKAGAVTTQESGITVQSSASAINGTAGNDVLTGGNGNDGIVTHGGVDTVSAGNGDDRIYESNTALAGQYDGGQGFDTLVLDFTGNQVVNLDALATHAHGIERIDLGNNSFKVHSTNLHIDTLATVENMVDTGTTRMLVQGGPTNGVTLADATHLVKVAVSSQDNVYFDVYQAAGHDIQLWLQQGLAVTHV